jgi:c-di-GMP-binding flagellar brake protein YcgR
MDREKVQEDVLHGKILNIALGTRVQVELGGIGGQFKSVMVGMEPEQYLIVKIPMMTGILSKLYEGNKVTLRYLYSGSIYGFRSNVLHFITKPAPLMFLTYPKAVEIFQLRESRRIDCHFPGQARIQEEQYEGAIVDVSSGGCRFSIDVSGDVRVAQIEVGESIDLSFQMIGSTQPLAALGKVRTISRDQGKVVIGIQFEELDTEVVESLESVIKSFWPIDDDH